MIVLVVRNLAANAGDTRDAGSVPGWGRPPAGGNGNPLQSSCLENSMDRGVWWATVHGATKSQTQLRDWAHQICSLSNFLCVQIYFLYSEMIHIRTNQRERHTRIGRELEGLKFIALCTVPVNLGHLALPTHLQKALPIWMLTHLQGPQLLLGFHYIGLTDLSLAP